MSLASRFPTLHLKRTVLPPLLLLVVLLALTVPAVQRARMSFYDDSDERQYHYPTVQLFAKQLPRPDLHDYGAATAPLYHLTLAAVGRVAGTEVRTLRYVNLALSACCILIVYGVLRLRHSVAASLIATLLVLLSLYFLGPAVRLSTDNPALACTVLSVSLLARPRFTSGWFALVALFVVSAILIRQTSAWLLPAFVLVVWQHSRGRPLRPRDGVAFASALAIPCLALASLVVLWGGLTPPSFHDHTLNTPNLDAPLFALCLLGAFGLAFSGSFPSGWPGRRAAVVVGCALVATILLTLHPLTAVYGVSTLNPRGGSLWAFAAWSGGIASSAIPFWVLLPSGLAAFLVLFIRKNDEAPNALWPIALCWLVATALNGRTYQKYYEPFVIFLCCWSLPSPMFRSWRAVVVPAVLVLAFACAAVYRFVLGS